MLRRHYHIGSAIASLEQVPIALHAVRRYVAVYVLACLMIDCRVLVSRRHTIIALPGVRIDPRACFHVLDDLTLQRVGGRIGYYHCPHIHAALPHAKYDCLGESALPHFLPLVSVHGLGLLTDHRLVNLNSSFHLGEAAPLHSLSNSMLHKPGRLLRDAKRTRQFTRGDAILRGRDQPNRRQPVTEGNLRLLEDCATLSRKLLFARLIETNPPAILGHKRSLHAFTMGACYLAVRPAHRS